jgi:hypothetical protein
MKKQIEEIEKEIEEKRKEIARLQEESKERETEEIILKDYAILDPSNCVGIFPCIKKDDEECEEFEIKGMGFFKRINKPKISLTYSNFECGETVKIENTKYSKAFIDQIKKMGSVWYGKGFNIYMVWDKEAKVFLDNLPLAIVYGNNMCFVLAPRCETEEDLEGKE